MITVGEILATARIRKRLTLEQVEKATRIRSKFLEAIESDQFDKLPPGTFARGFIKNYAAYLGISPDEAMAFYRRQSSEKPVDVVPMKNQRNLARKFSLTPQLLTTISIVFLVICFFAYLAFSYFRYAVPMFERNVVDAFAKDVRPVEVIPVSEPKVPAIVEQTKKGKETYEENW
jgi:cytoskeletal protein RodZ